MKNIIKKLSILLFLIILMTTTSFSSTISNRTEQDSIVFLTPLQLKETNLIFAEHFKLLKENQLLIQQVDNYKEDNRLLVINDSIRQVQINKLNKSFNESITKKDKTLLYWKVGGITVSSSLLLLLLLK